MRCAVPGLATLALFVSSVHSPALAFAAPGDVSVPTAAQVEALCPDIGHDGLHLGKPMSEQGPAALVALRMPDERFAPFSESDLTFTAWSGLLAAVTWRRAAPEGVSLIEWQDELVNRLENAGWAAVAEPVIPANWYSRQLVKSFEHDGGTRELLLDVDTFGLYSVRCADAALLVLNETEGRGELAEGTPRPVRPPSSTEFDQIIGRLDCEDEAILAAFAGTDDLQAAGAKVEQILGPPGDLNAGAEYHTKLRTWLRWRMLESGLISEDELWAIEDSVPVERPDPSADMTRFLTAAAGIIKAGDASDGGAMCRGYRKMLTGENRISAAKAERERAVNTALEAEARRRDIAVD